MLSTTLLAYLTLIVQWATSEAVGALPGGVSKTHRQQDDHGNYNFGYEVQDPASHQFRRESGDAYGRVVGSYGLSEADGRQRIVDYVADEYGFRAKVRTNEPGTKSENSAAVEVLKPGDPPGPPRIPNLSVGPPGPPLPPPPHHSPSNVISPKPPAVKSHISLPVREPSPYIHQPPNYDYPYYYSPPYIPYGNTIYSEPQTRQPIYVNYPHSYKNIQGYQYKPPINPQPYAPIPPFEGQSSHKYSPYAPPFATQNSRNIPSPPVPSFVAQDSRNPPPSPYASPFSAQNAPKYSPGAPSYNPSFVKSQPNLNLPRDGPSNHRLGLIGNTLPSNYKVIPIPNGIQAIPIDSPESAVNIGGGVYRGNYPYYPENYPRGNYPENYPRGNYPSDRDLSYLDSKPHKSSYSPRDHQFSSSKEVKTVASTDTDANKKSKR